jgi:hypothetical protein
MAQKIAGGQEVSSSQSLTQVFHNLKISNTNLTSKVDSIKATARKLLDDQSLSGGQADVVRENLEDIANTIEHIVASNKKLVEPLDRGIGGAVTLQHGHTASNAREENKKLTSGSGVLSKE